MAYVVFGFEGPGEGSAPKACATYLGPTVMQARVKTAKMRGVYNVGIS